VAWMVAQVSTGPTTPTSHMFTESTSLQCMKDHYHLQKYDRTQIQPHLTCELIGYFTVSIKQTINNVVYSMHDKCSQQLKHEPTYIIYIITCIQV
jgi:hypothetical protein